VFFRIGGLGKAAQIPEEGQENKVSAGNSTESKSRHQMLGKTLHKENSRPRAGFNARYEVVQEEERTKGKGFRPGMAFYRRGRVRGWRMCRGP
jgi:hypothetical protein